MIIASKNTELKQKCHCSKAWKRCIYLEAKNRNRTYQ